VAAGANVDAASRKAKLKMVVFLIFPVFARLLPIIGFLNPFLCIKTNERGEGCKKIVNFAISSSRFVFCQR